MLDRHGEPPVVESDDDPAFSDWLRTAVIDVASSRVRRLWPSRCVGSCRCSSRNEQFKEALALDYNAYLTVMSDAVTPLLARW